MMGRMRKLVVLLVVVAVIMRCWRGVVAEKQPQAEELKKAEVVWRDDEDHDHVVDHDEDSKTSDDGKHHHCSLGNYMSGTCTSGEH
ncbi:UNVERIFIED_CONTAM: hypothetical protein Slati_0644700 [Sesamum latifolium]|uniref:Uncharacterized protein n=1 Tax=Sesamum latifolium TaxID=2727402 RepID=A0AAW2Y343_9LAMI